MNHFKASCGFLLTTFWIIKVHQDIVIFFRIYAMQKGWLKTSFAINKSNFDLGIHERKKWAMYVSMNWQNDKSQASRNCQDCLMSKWTITHVTFKGNPSSQFLFTNSLQITNTWYSALWFSIHNILLLIHVLHSMLIIHIKNLDKKLS